MEMTQSSGEYQFLMGSDIERDGMFMEMLDESGACVAEVFYSDATHNMVVTLERQGYPSRPFKNCFPGRGFLFHLSRSPDRNAGE